MGGLLAGCQPEPMCSIDFNPDSGKYFGSGPEVITFTDCSAKSGAFQEKVAGLIADQNLDPNASYSCTLLNADYNDSLIRVGSAAHCATSYCPTYFVQVYVPENSCRREEQIGTVSTTYYFADTRGSFERVSAEAERQAACERSSSLCVTPEPTDLSDHKRITGWASDRDWNYIVDTRSLGVVPITTDRLIGKFGRFLLKTGIFTED